MQEKEMNNCALKLVIFIMFVAGTPSWQLENDSSSPGTASLLPANPIPALENTAYHLTASPAVLSGSTITSPGDEQWYALTPSSDITIVTVTPDVDSEVLVTLYNSAGVPFGTALSIGNEQHTPGHPAEYLALTQPGTLYYLRVQPMTMTGNLEAAVTMIYYPGPPDGDEENDSFEQALPLPAGTQAEGLHLDLDYYVFQVDEGRGTDIEIKINFIESPDYVMSLYLYDNNSTHTRLYSREYIDADAVIHVSLFTGGKYFLCLYPESWEKNAQYSIEWQYQ
jgi:hypothetical protein